MRETVLEGRPKQSPGVWMRQAGGENVVYDPATDRVHVLNDTATAIWTLCDGQTEPDEMIAAVCDLSGLPREVVQEDVGRILTDFEHVGIVSWSE